MNHLKSKSQKTGILYFKLKITKNENLDIYYGKQRTKDLNCPIPVEWAAVRPVLLK